jgi:hypothetical protein
MPPVESPALSTPPIAWQAQPAVVDADFDARWNAWRARGVANERATRRRALQLLPVLALAIVAVIVYVFI